ncbi:MAG: hypothetical protein LBC27_04560, partial [Spirochaetaceae bacterium]|nr:hypothetical protein [Spirochaetaceae bacterium]
MRNANSGCLSFRFRAILSTRGFDCREFLFNEVYIVSISFFNGNNTHKWGPAPPPRGGGEGGGGGGGVGVGCGW